MDKILVLFHSVGEYEDRRDYPLCASTSKEKLQQYQAERNACLVRMNWLYDQVNEFCRQYREQHPLPHSAKLEAVPRWKQGLRKEEITTEMRAERESITARNNLRSWAARIAYAKWDEAKDRAVEDYINGLDATDEEKQGIRNRLEHCVFNTDSVAGRMNHARLVFHKTRSYL
jgi:hypothetical protein